MSFEDSDDSRDDEDLTLACNIRDLRGKVQTVWAARTWRVWELQDEIEEELGIPDYEQRLACGSISMKGESVLSSFLPTDDSSRLDITLVRSAVPACFDADTASRIWQAFSSFSVDGGGTIDSSSVSDVMRYAGMFDSSREFGTEVASGRLTFPELLQLLASWKEAVEPTPPTFKEVEHELSLLDEGNTGFVSSHAFWRLVHAWVVSYGSEDDDAFERFDMENDDLVEWRPLLRQVWPASAGAASARGARA
eukprot:TRINITY_DN47032_c0_g1_i1.p1 TRINITY_DN47032_c0_g1~~TRINITY_DN47032_c0_g1_i1.p1  ORF type:complete len:251 (-),score=49.77 TRINITY_DN47032_c0_g1_i1:55-807(-)